MTDESESIEVDIELDAITLDLTCTNCDWNRHVVHETGDDYGYLREEFEAHFGEVCNEETADITVVLVDMDVSFGYPDTETSVNIDEDRSVDNIPVKSAEMGEMEDGEGE